MGIELRDDRGLICGFRLEPHGPAQDIELSALSQSEPPAGLIWLHLNFSDTRAINWVANCSWLPPEGRETLLSGDRSIRLDPLGGGFAGALADLFVDEPERSGLVHLYVDQTCLITGRRHPLTAVGLLRQDLLDGASVPSIGALFTRLMRHLVAARAKAIADYAVAIDNAEDRVFARDYHGARLGQHRRAMALLRRPLVADRLALAALCAQPPAWWGKPAGKELRRVAGMLSSIGQDLELVEERARLLSEEIDSRIIERTNRNLYFISAAATVFLPITLISGIFGMNVGGLPWLENENGFWWVMICMATAISFGLGWVYWRRLL